MSHLTERADKFAQKLKPQPPPDERSEDEKWADFSRKWSSTNDFLRQARRQKDNA